MASLHVKVRLIKFKAQLKLVESIRLIDQTECFYFPPEYQFVCQHKKFQKIEFENYRQAPFKLNSKEYLDYFEPISRRFRFNGVQLFSEPEYRSYVRRHEQRINNLFDEHLHLKSACACVQKYTPKQIKRTAKCDPQQVTDIIVDVSSGFRYADIADKYKITTKTIQNLVRKWKQKRLAKSPRRIGYTALTKYHQEEILSFVHNHPDSTFLNIKRALRLRCSIKSIRVFLRKQKIRSFISLERPELFPIHVKLRDRFAEMMSQVSKTSIEKLVFTDEKTMQNRGNGRVRVLRKRGEGWKPR